MDTYEKIAKQLEVGSLAPEPAVLTGARIGAFAVGKRRDQGLDGEVVDRSGNAAAGLVQQRDGVVAEQGVGAAGELEMVLEVADGLAQVHAVEVVAQPDALVEGGHGALLDAVAQGGLAEQQAGEWAAGVHVVVGEHADFFELFGAEQVGFVDFTDRDRPNCAPDLRRYEDYMSATEPQNLRAAAEKGRWHAERRLARSGWRFSHG